MKKQLKLSIFCGLGAAAIGLAIVKLQINYAKTEAVEIAKHYNLKDITYDGFNPFCAKGTIVAAYLKAKNEQNEDVEVQMCAKRFIMPDNVTIKKLKKI